MVYVLSSSSILVALDSGSQTKLKQILQTTSDQFTIDPSKDDLGHRIDVEAHYNRKIALIAADAELDKIQVGDRLAFCIQSMLTCSRFLF
jgi:hypothetical protein